MEWDKPIISLLWEKFSSPFVTAMSAICTLDSANYIAQQLTRIPGTIVGKEKKRKLLYLDFQRNTIWPQTRTLFLPIIVIVQSFEGYTPT